jgi:hypothetical protein
MGTMWLEWRKVSKQRSDLIPKDQALPLNPINRLGPVLRIRHREWIVAGGIGWILVLVKR